MAIRFLKVTFSKQPTAVQRLRMLSQAMQGIDLATSTDTNVVAFFSGGGTVQVTRESTAEQLPLEVISDTTSLVVLKIGNIFYRMRVATNVFFGMSSVSGATESTENTSVSLGFNAYFADNGGAWTDGEITGAKSVLFQLEGSNKIDVLVDSIFPTSAAQYRQTPVARVNGQPAVFQTNYGPTIAIPFQIKETVNGIYRKPAFRFKVYAQDTKTTFDLSAVLGCRCIAYDRVMSDAVNIVTTGGVTYRAIGHFLIPAQLV